MGGDDEGRKRGGEETRREGDDEGRRRGEQDTRRGGASRQIEQYCSGGSRGLVLQPRGDSDAVVIAMQEW